MCVLVYIYQLCVCQYFTYHYKTTIPNTRCPFNYVISLLLDCFVFAYTGFRYNHRDIWCKKMCTQYTYTFFAVHRKMFDFSVVVLTTHFGLFIQLPGMLNYCFTCTYRQLIDIPTNFVLLFVIFVNL